MARVSLITTGMIVTTLRLGLGGSPPCFSLDEVWPLRHPPGARRGVALYRVVTGEGLRSQLITPRPGTNGCPTCHQHFCYVCLRKHGRPCAGGCGPRALLCLLQAAEPEKLGARQFCMGALTCLGNLVRFWRPGQRDWHADCPAPIPSVPSAMRSTLAEQLGDRCKRW